MEQEIPQEQYERIVWNMVNFGMDVESSGEADHYIKLHIDMMDREKALGKPRGEAVWAGYLKLLHYLMNRKAVLEARETAETEGYFPMFYEAR